MLVNKEEIFLQLGIQKKQPLKDILIKKVHKGVQQLRSFCGECVWLSIQANSELRTSEGNGMEWPPTGSMQHDVDTDWDTCEWITMHTWSLWPLALASFEISHSYLHKQSLSPLNPHQSCHSMAVATQNAQEENGISRATSSEDRDYHFPSLSTLARGRESPVQEIPVFSFLSSVRVRAG